MSDLVEVFKNASKDAKDEIDRTSDGMVFKEDTDIVIEAGIKAVLAAQDKVYTAAMYKPDGDSSHCSCCRDPYSSEFELLATKDRNALTDAIARCYTHNATPHSKGYWYITLLINGVSVSSFDSDPIHGLYDSSQFEPTDDPEAEKYHAVMADGAAVYTEAMAKVDAIKAEIKRKADIAAEQDAEKKRLEQEEKKRKAAEAEHATYLELKLKYEGQQPTE